MSGERLRWNDDEMDRLERAALPLLVADPKMLLIEAVRRVQDTVLSQDRRRNLVNIGSLPILLRNRLEVKRKAATGSADLVPAEDLAAAMKLAEEAQAKIKELEEAVRQANAESDSLRAHVVALQSRPPVPTELEVLEGFLTRVIAGAMAKRDEVPGGPRDVPPPPPPVAAFSSIDLEEKRKADEERKRLENGDGKPRPPKILVCGLRPDQRAYFETHFNGRARIKFWWQEGASNNEAGLADKARNVDFAYMLMDAVSHNAVAIVARETKGRYQRVATRNRDALRDLIEAQLSKVAA